MHLRNKNYISIVDLMRNQVDPSFKALITACMELCECFKYLHLNGLCYRDISFGNVFFSPETGEVAICDNDNVGVDGEKAEILGTPRFMSPEIVRGEALPSIDTDLYSLAVLLFHILMVHHPLDGKKELQIHSFDAPAMKKLYGDEPVFIWDPKNDTNRPDQQFHSNAIVYWNIYPTFIKERFIEAFTVGINNPKHGRVRESTWLTDLCRLRDSIQICSKCKKENFYDQTNVLTGLIKCWACKTPLQLPPRMKIENSIVVLNENTKLYSHHIDRLKLNDFSTIVASVKKHPTLKDILGIENHSTSKWVCTTAEGRSVEIPQGKSATIRDGVKIVFGTCEGIIRF
jgi:serine/threonine protein kinase